MSGTPDFTLDPSKIPKKQRAGCSVKVPRKPSGEVRGTAWQRAQGLGGQLVTRRPAPHYWEAMPAPLCPRHQPGKEKGERKSLER